MGEVVVALSDVDDGLNERLDDEIYAFNAAATGLDDREVVQVQGGAVIELLWVRADQRGSGLGTRVLTTAEEEVRRRGCEQVALSTHSFQAPRFYARRGYVECGRTPAYPRGHDQIHLVKRLR